MSFKAIQKFGKDNQQSLIIGVCAVAFFMIAYFMWQRWSDKSGEESQSEEVQMEDPQPQPEEAQMEEPQPQPEESQPQTEESQQPDGSVASWFFPKRYDAK